MPTRAVEEKGEVEEPGTPLPTLLRHRYQSNSGLGPTADIPPTLLANLFKPISNEQSEPRQPPRKFFRRASPGFTPTPPPPPPQGSPDPGGSLIASPTTGRMRRRGTTAFMDIVLGNHSSEVAREFSATVVDAADLRRPGDPDKRHKEKAFLILHPFSKKR